MGGKSFWFSSSCSVSCSPESSISSSLLLIFSFAVWRLFISISLWNIKTQKWSKPMMVPVYKFKDAMNLGENKTYNNYYTKHLEHKTEHAQTLIRDLMLLNLKDLLGSSGRWNVLDGDWTFGLGPWASTTWPLWHRMSSVFSLWVKVYSWNNHTCILDKLIQVSVLFIQHCISARAKELKKMLKL